VQARLLRLTVTDPDENPASWAIQRTRVFEAVERTIDTTPRIGQMVVDEVLRTVPELHGDAVVGKALFTRLSCVACHTTEANETPKGPFLPTVLKTYTRRQLAEAILLPSKNILPDFKTQIIVTADGKTIQGFVVAEDATTLTLRETNANELKVVKADIDDRQLGNQSLMPENLVSSLKTEELASLLDYLESIKAQ
jgi:putative heme-binding domain-containing protein